MTSLRANALLLLAAFFWGSGNVSQKLVLEDIGPLTAVGLRCLIGVVAILPFVWRELMRHHSFVLPPRLIEVSALFAGAIAVQQAAFGATTVTNASFLVSTTTVITPLVVWVLLRTRPTLAIWAAVAAAFAGAVMMSGGSISSLAGGDLLCLLSAVLYSVWFVRLGRLVVESGRPGFVTIVQLLLTGIVGLVLGLVTEPVAAGQIVRAFPNLVVLGVFATGLAFGLQAIAQQYACASTAAVLTSAESLFGAAAAALILGERLTAGMWLGAALVVAAILTVQLATSRSRAIGH